MGAGAFITRSMGRVARSLSRHAPELWIAGGIVSGLAATGFAIYSTTKARRVVDDHNARMDVVRQKEEEFTHVMKEDGTEIIVELDQDQKSEIGRLTLKEYAITAGRYAALYAPTIAFTGVSIASVLIGHGLLRKRYLGVVAAYTALQTRFDEYKRKTIEKYGVDADREIERSIAEDHANTVNLDEKTDDGEPKTKLTYNSEGWSNLDRVFDETSWRYDDRHADRNYAYLKGAEKRANVKLATDGWLSLNWVYHELGLPKTKAGMVMGWLYEPEGNGANDITGEVSFGLQDDEKYRLSTISGDGYERSVPLHFGGAGFGLIYDKVPLADI